LAHLTSVMSGTEWSMANRLVMWPCVVMEETFLDPPLVRGRLMRRSNSLAIRESRMLLSTSSTYAETCM